MNGRAPQRRRKLRDVRIAPSDWPTDRHRRILFDVVAVVTLTTMVLILGGKDIRVGGFDWSDAPLHAMDGVLLYDLARERHVGGDVAEWATRYYARYPCLGLVVYYPPFHPFIEAVSYALFGISEGVARATVVGMAWVAVVGLYWLGVQLFGRPGAWGAAGLLATAPFGLSSLRDVMLEWPATAMAVLAAGCYRAWYAKPSWRWAILGALTASLAVLTKQTTLFILLVFAIHLLTAGAMSVFRHTWASQVPMKLRQGDLRLAAMVAVAAIIVLLTLGVYDRISSRYAEFSRFLVSGRPPWNHLGEAATYTQYFQWFGEIFGWPFLVAWVTGLVWILLRREWQGSYLALLWLVLLWVQQTLVAWKMPRYFFFALPAAALLAGRGWTLWPRWRRLPIGLIPLTGLIGYQFVTGVRTPTRRLPDYSAAVELLTRQSDADVVLVDGVRDGQFVFDVRSDPRAAGRIITLRGSKTLYSRAARGRWSHTTLRGTPEEILELLNQYGIRYIVVESQLPVIPESARIDWEEPASNVLREMLAEENRFTLIGRFPLGRTDPSWADVELRVYRYLQAPARRASSIRIPIAALGREVEVPLTSAPTIQTQ
mgnify:CR=1 FL=1